MDIGHKQKQADKLKEWYTKYGLVTRKKRSGGHKKTALNLKDIQVVTRFILYFIDQNSLILPGHVSGFKHSDVQILLSCETKVLVWRQYTLSAEPDQHVIKLSTFNKLWSQLLLYIVVAKPISDLCWVCQRNNTNIVQVVNVPEEEEWGAENAELSSS